MILSTSLFLSTAILSITSNITSLSPTMVTSTSKPQLQFTSTGTFKIVQFTDIHNGKVMDPRTYQGMCKILDSEKPNFVILTGDQVSTGSISSASELKSSIEQLGKPMEARKIPWAMVYGNHDTDNLSKIGVTKDQMLEYYRAQAHNLNPSSPAGIYGSGNGLLTISGSNSKKPAMGIWVIDSNAYAPEIVNGQKMGGYDWIHSDQIEWYKKTSRDMEKKLKNKLPSLMFFHICLVEHGLAVSKLPFTGEKNEPECPANINSGLFTALLERGDVFGVYVGHDHTNTYEVNYLGIRLGYGGSIGYTTYGLSSDDPLVKDSIRGARVFEIDESTPQSYKTHYVKVDSLK